MRKLLLLCAILLLSASLWAQKGKSRQQQSREVVLGGSRTEQPSTSKKDRGQDNEQQAGRSTDPIWQGTAGPEAGKGKPSKNQPAPVRAAFARDFPHATGVTWSKYRGDWTATFGSGFSRTTVVYHANGERKDTRTVVPRTRLPRPVLEDIIKRGPGTRLGDIVRIEAPRSITDIFRIKTTQNGTTRYLFYDENGKQVSYDY